MNQNKDINYETAIVTIHNIAYSELLAAVRKYMCRLETKHLHT